MKKSLRAIGEEISLAEISFLIRFTIHIPYRTCLFSAQVNFSFGYMENRVGEEREYLITQERNVCEKYVYVTFIMTHYLYPHLLPQ